VGLNQCCSSDEGIEGLKELLNNPKLEILEMNDIGLGDNGLVKILNELNNSNCRIIIMNGNNFTDKSG